MTQLSLPIRLNCQPVEKQELDPKGILDVVNIFPTIQGEGPYAGEPCVFVRLAGCNLQCPSCDTDYTANRFKEEPDDLAEKIIFLMPPKSNLVVITGGEPFRQNLLPLIRRLFDRKLRVQIETNGTLFLPGLEGLYALTSLYPSNLTIVCSPKTGGINLKLTSVIDVLKYVVSSGKVDPDDGLPLDSLGSGVRVERPWSGFQGEIHIQPCDDSDPEKNRANLAEAVNSCLKFGYKLSIQLHKIANLP